MRRTPTSFHLLFNLISQSPLALLLIFLLSSQLQLLIDLEPSNGETLDEFHMNTSVSPEEKFLKSDMQKRSLMASVIPK